MKGRMSKLLVHLAASWTVAHVEVAAEPLSYMHVFLLKIFTCKLLLILSGGTLSSLKVDANFRADVVGIFLLRQKTRECVKSPLELSFLIKPHISGINKWLARQWREI